jgi:hypothetical protein
LEQPGLLRKGAMGADEYRGAARLCLIREFTEGRMGDRIKATEGFIEYQQSDWTQERLGENEFLAISF